MSRIHIVFIKTDHTDRCVVYQVHSPDFDGNELIGEVRFDLSTGNFHFYPLGALQGKPVIPLTVFDLPEEEQAQIISKDYPGNAYGGWMRRIAKMAKKTVIDGEYPQEVFGVT